MSALWCRAGLLISLLLGVTGCSSLHVDVSRDFNWAAIDTLALEEPTNDRWTLAPLITTELRRQGFELIQPGEPGVDSLLRYQTTEKPDLDAQGNLSNRLESVHLQFLDPATGKRQAVIDYFYPTSDSSHSVAEGIEEALAGLRSAQPATQTANRKPKPAPQPQPAPAAGANKQNSDSATAQKSAHQAQAPRPAVSPKTSAVAAGTSATNESTAAETAPEEPRSQTRSPWVPRFQSWGFDSWGEDEDSDFGY